MGNVKTKFIAYYGRKVNYMGHLKEYYDAMTFYELSEGIDVETIICAVEEIINTKEVDISTNCESIQLAFDNAIYYIRDDYTQYYFDERCRELRDAAKTIIKEGSFDGAGLVWWNKNIVELIHQVFDEEYFLNQMVHLRRSKTSGCKTGLRSVLYKLNMEQLKQYYQLISYGVERFHWFVNEIVWDLMHCNLYSEAYDQIPGDAVHNELAEDSSQSCFLDYIDKKEIAENLFTAIEYHTFIAETVAEILYDLGYDEAFIYLNTAL